MNLLSREALLGATGCPEETVHIPALGGEVIVRGLTGVELDAYHQAITVGKGNKRDVNMANLRTKLVVRCVVDASGRRVFGDDDADALSKIRGDVIGKLFTVAQKLSGLSDEEVEELGKPSSTTEPGTSSSS